MKWLFLPLDEVAKAVDTKGLYPSPKVAADLVLPTFQADNAEELTGFVARFKRYLSDDQDKEHGANCLEAVFELTLCSRTAHNPHGAKLGKPLLVSNTPETISTGGFKNHQRRWSKKSRWSSPAIEELCKLTVKDLFLKLRSTESEIVIKLFEELCLYVFSKSLAIPLSNLESRVALARSAEVLEARNEDEEENDDEDLSDDDAVIQEIGAEAIDEEDEGGNSDVELCDDNS